MVRAMGWKNTLFDDDTSGHDSAERNREVSPLERLKNLEEKIAVAVERVKALKEEKNVLESKLREYEEMLNEKNQEIEAMKSEKSSIGVQLEELLTELDTFEG